MRSLLLPATGAILVLALSASAPGLDTAETLRSLASPDYATREAATAALRADATLTPERIRELYAAATTPEARHRLLDAARHHLIRPLQEKLSVRAGPGSLGVMLTDPAVREPAESPDNDAADAERPAVQIAATLAGFPAHVLLRAGDRIVAVNGQPLVAGPREDLNKCFKDRVQKHASGETVELSVERDGRPLTLRVPLASQEALTALYLSGGQGLQKPLADMWSKFVASLHPPQPLPALQPDFAQIPASAAGPTLPVRVIENEAGGMINVDLQLHDEE